MSDSPLMQQYREVKQRHPGALVLFRVGDFFELFEADAEAACAALGLALTSRDRGVPMAGFPHHALDGHVRKLVQAGHCVAVCDQITEPSDGQGLLRREVVRVLTPGTLTEDDLLDPRRANHLASVWTEGERIGLAWADLSTGAFQTADVDWARLPDELGRLAPAECLHAENAPARLTDLLAAAVPGMVRTPRPAWLFDPASARAALFHHFGVSTTTGFGLDDRQPCVCAAGAVLLYLRETCKAGLAHLRRPRPYRPEGHLLLDEATRRGLELTATQREGRIEGSLLAYLDRTVTGMGDRLFRESLLAPLTDQPAIEARLDAVGELVESTLAREELRDLLRRVSDLHRLSARAATGRASPRDLATVARTLRLLPSIQARLGELPDALCLRELDRVLETCPELCQMLDSALAENAPADPREGGMIRDGHDAALDELREASRSGKEWLARFQAEEAVRTGISGLKVGFTQVFGYYIEIGNTHAQKVPPHYQRKQTLKNAERYVTTELKEHEERVLQAEEQMRQREQELFAALRHRVTAEAGRLQRAGDVLARLDVLTALGELASERGYCRPELSDEAILEIEGGRHPVLDQSLPAGTVVPNDTFLGTQHGRLWLITGPNLSGKSTFIRQTALLALMAQMGSFVPARRARIGIVDRIFTGVGASDDLTRGQSTFMVEMTEAANILNNASASLVILDEIGRGTSTYDGVSLAWAITEYLHDRIGCRALFATHYHELARLADSLEGLRNYNALVHEGPDGIVFLRRIAAGSADRSYGIHVARLAGVPQEVLQRAEQVLGQLESGSAPGASEPAVVAGVIV